MTKRNGGNNTAISTGLSDTRARLAWSATRRPSLVRALTTKESFEEAKELVLRAYADMLRARLVDQKAIALYKQNKSFFQIGVAGHEAIQVAAAMHFDKNLDYFFPYYRGMAFCAALGMSNETFMLNCMSKAADPNSHGRQMPMHYGEKRLHIPSQSSVVATQLLAATGCALALKLQQEDGIVYVSSGDGGCCEGDFHECLSWASKDKLPLIIVIENNEYAISTPLSDLIGAKSPFELGQGYSNLKRLEVDGTDFFESYDVMQEACSFARSGDGPVLIDAHVVRLQSHSISDNHLKYRREEELKREKLSCPILKLNQYLVSNRICSQKYLDSLEVELQNEIDGAAEWAEQQPDPKKSDVLVHVYSEDSTTPSTEEKAPFGAELFLIDAINQALNEEMSLNPNIYVFGQDVAKQKGGVFGATKGLSEKHGDSRCFNSPLAESSIVGVAIGMALQGLKPVVEIQFGDYTWYAMMQLRNEMAMMRYRSGGEWFCPAVIRIPVGGYIRGASYHSQNIEATFAHFPGLKIVYPSNASDAKGLLKSAIRGEDPVLFLEHKGLYRQNYAKGPVGDPSFTVPIGKAKVLKEGNNATVVTWGALVQKSLLAAKEIEKNGTSIEVIDLRSIVPFDSETVFKSVQKTNRLLIAHEDVQFMGFSAEISAQIAEHCFPYLDAPIRRVGGKPVAAIPQAEALEAAALPQDEDVLEALNALLKY